MIIFGRYLIKLIILVLVFLDLKIIQVLRRVIVLIRKLFYIYEVKFRLNVIHITSVIQLFILYQRTVLTSWVPHTPFISFVCAPLRNALRVVKSPTD